MKLFVMFFVLGFSLDCVYCDDLKKVVILGTKRSEEMLHLPEAEIDKIELNETDMEAARNLDAGKYSTVSYEYFNDQYLKAPGEHIIYNDSCVDEYIRCTLSMSVETPVCAFNNPDRAYGYMTTITFCEVYFDNCRRGYRFWRIIDQGECKFVYGNDWDNVVHTRRSDYPLIVHLLKVLSSQANTKTSPSNDPEKNQIDPAIKQTWREIEGKRLYEESSEIPNTRRLNHPLAADLLKILSTQSGNTRISVSKGRALSILPEPFIKY